MKKRRMIRLPGTELAPEARITNELNLFQGCGRSLSADNLDGLYKELELCEKSGLWVAERKEDGIFATVHMSLEGNKFVSRNGLEKDTQLNGLIVPQLQNYVFAAELGYGSQASYIEKERNGLDADENFVRIFSLVGTRRDNGIILLSDMTEVEQRQILQEMWHTLDAETKKRFQLVERWDTDFVDHYRDIVERRGEGLVLKTKNNIYIPGTRSQYWMKVKKTITVDMVILNMELSDALAYKDKGLAKAIICGAYVDGTLKSLTRVGSMTNEWRHEFGQNFKLYKHKVAEIHAFEQFKSGALRHPSFLRLRPDKKAEECIFSH